MRKILLTGLAILLGLAGSAFAQNSGDVEAAVEAALPQGWSLSRFAILDEPPAGAIEPGGKVVGAPIDEGGVADTKLPDEPFNSDVIYFGGALAATEAIYEPLYALDGMAIVRALFEPGFEIPVTGAFDGSDVRFDQGGVAQLGRPLGGFDVPALVEGSAEAEEFLASRGAATAEGTMGKLMNEDGDPL